MVTSGHPFCTVTGGELRVSSSDCGRIELKDRFAAAKLIQA